jgi:hypothetical protein
MFDVRKNASAQSVVNEIGRNITKLERFSRQRDAESQQAETNGSWFTDGLRYREDSLELFKMAKFLKDIQGHVARVTGSEVEGS